MNGLTWMKLKAAELQMETLGKIKLNQEALTAI